MNFDRFQLPAHIAYTQSLSNPIAYNLSHSCAQALSVEQLCQLANKNIDEVLLEYSAVRGGHELRAAIADYTSRFSSNVVDFNSEHVVTFCGAQEALSGIYQTILSPGDEVIVCTPCYPSLVSMARKMECKVVEIVLSADNHWQLTIEMLKSKVSANTKLIVINSPQNPTGSVVDTHLAGQILALARQFDCYLLCDDVSQASNYHELQLKHDALSYEKAVSVGVMSKSLGLAGIRIGWLVTTNQKWLQALTAYKATASICTSAVDERLATMALQHSQAILETNNSLILKNIDFFQSFVDENSSLFAWSQPQAGLLAVVEYKGENGINKLSAKLANEYQTLVLPTKLFGLAGNYFRLGLGQRNFQLGLERLSLYVEKLQARQIL